MKTPSRSLLLIATLSAQLATHLNAQKEITLDLASHSYAGLNLLDTLKEGQTYRVSVTGVNLNLYKISVNGRDSSTAVALTFPGFGDVAIDAITKLTGGLSLSTASARPVDLMADPQGFKLFHYNYNYEVANKKAPTRDRVRELMAQTIALRNVDIKRLSKDLLATKARIDAVGIEVLTQGYALRALLPAAAGTTVAQHLDGIAAIRKDLLAKLNEVSTLQEDFAKSNAIPEVVALFDRDKAIKADAESVVKALDALIKNASDQLTSIDATNTAKVLDPLHMLQLNAGKTFCSAPFQYKGGSGLLTISAAPQETGSRLPSYRTAYSFPKPPKGYWGVSAGLYGSWLYSDAYSTVTTKGVFGEDTLDAYTVVQEEVDQHEFGAQALMTVGTTCPKIPELGVHLVVGPGVGIADKVRPRALLGIGLSYGKQHKLVLDGGIIAGWVDRRSAAFADDGPYRAPADKPTTVSRLDSSFFLSLGYLFWKGK